MSEFRIHHDVNELLSLLRVHSGEGAEVYIDLLQKNRTPYVTTTVSAHSAKVHFDIPQGAEMCFRPYGVGGRTRGVARFLRTLTEVLMALTDSPSYREIKYKHSSA